jgi:hypothetical protein
LGTGAKPQKLILHYFWSLLPGAGAGAIGDGDVVPAPVVLGGIIFVCALPVVIGDEPLLALLELLFQPVITTKAVNANTARPAIKPQMPPTLLSRCRTGSVWGK